jgi:hypothetical protein
MLRLGNAVARRCARARELPTLPFLNQEREPGRDSNNAERGCDDGPKPADAILHQDGDLANTHRFAPVKKERRLNRAFDSAVNLRRDEETIWMGIQ